jgi:hypothetical protein
MKNLIRGRSRLLWQNVNFYENIKFNREKKGSEEGFDGNKNALAS